MHDFSCFCHRYGVAVGCFLILFVMLTISAGASSIAFLPSDLFDEMENQTKKIDAMSALVELKNNYGGSKQVRLSVKSPNKFSIEFYDKSVSAFFNGNRLWIYLRQVNEVFYHFSDTSSRFTSYFSFFNPAKLFANMTRRTLFAFFEILPVSKSVQSNGETHYTMKFVPRMKSVFKEIFSVGYYEMIFSDRNYMPFEVVEFSQSGSEKGRLRVLEYKMNEELSDESFNFYPPPGAIMVPVNVVIAQKIEEYGKSLLNKINSAADRLKRSLYDWSF